MLSAQDETVFIVASLSPICIKNTTKRVLCWAFRRLEPKSTELPVWGSSTRQDRINRGVSEDRLAAPPPHRQLDTLSPLQPGVGEVDLQQALLISPAAFHAGRHASCHAADSAALLAAGTVPVRGALGESRRLSRGECSEPGLEFRFIRARSLSGAGAALLIAPWKEA